MNINNEIINMFNDFYLGNYPYHLRRVILSLPLIAPLNPLRRRGFVYKLTPSEEGAGGGWDGKITIPKGMTDDGRVIFIQYKRGNHSEGNNEPNSIFNLTKANPNKHVEFSFNSNSNNNQHQFLKNLSDDLISKGMSKDIVMYGFPRVTSKAKFEELSGNLLLYTTFLTLSEMDRESTKAKVNLYDNNPHTFRTCYQLENKREICSTPFQLTSNNNSSSVLYEIMALKIGHFWNLANKNTRYYSRLKIELQLMTAYYLKINPFKNDNFKFNEYQDIYEDGYFNYFDELENSWSKLESELFYSSNESNNIKEFRNGLFNKLNNFINEFSESPIELNKVVPSNFTQPIRDGIELNRNNFHKDTELTYLVI